MLIASVNGFRWRKRTKVVLNDPDADRQINDVGKRLGLPELEVIIVDHEPEKRRYSTNASWNRVFIEQSHWQGADGLERELLATLAVAELDFRSRGTWWFTAALASTVFLGGVLATQNLWLVPLGHLISLCALAYVARRSSFAEVLAVDRTALLLLKDFERVKDLIERSPKAIVPRAERIDSLQKAASELRLL